MKIRITVQLNDCEKVEAQTEYANICNRLRGVADMEIHSHYVDELTNPDDPEEPPEEPPEPEEG